VIRALRSHVMAASDLLNEQLGAVTHVEQNGGYVIRGESCPLSALTGKHPAVCRAMESLVKEFVGASVHECCERAQRPRCCFEIKSKGARVGYRWSPTRSASPALSLAASYSCAASSAKTTRLPAGSVTVAVFT
jgi:hypothetical protein